MASRLYRNRGAKHDVRGPHQSRQSRDSFSRGEAFWRHFILKLMTLVYEEEVLVKPRYADTGRLPRLLTVTNRYRYSEYDTLTLDNYRIGCRRVELWGNGEA